MNVTQETYHACLATVAPREVAAARANRTYEVTWNQKKHTATDYEIRLKILDLLAARPMTTEELRSRIGTTRTRAYNFMYKMEGDGLVKSKRVQVSGTSRALWSLA